MHDADVMPGDRPTTTAGGPWRWFAAGALAAGLGVVGEVLAVRRLRARARRLRGTLPHDGLLGEAPGTELRLALLGDSVAAGDGIADVGLALPRVLARRLVETRRRPVHVRGLAVSGATIADVTARQVPAAAGSDVVVVAVGVNDALRRRARDEVVADTDALLDALARQVPGARVVVATCPDLARAPGLPRVTGALVGWRCRVVARAQRHVLRARGVPAVVPGAVSAGSFGDDGIHPSAGSVTHLADLVVEALDREPYHLV